MDAAVRNLVRRRANERCEYCRLPQKAVDPKFHVEHIVAKQHGGEDDPSNLALACARCNLHKGPNLTGIHPETGQIVPLFHPWTDAWKNHFRFRGPEIIGLVITRFVCHRYVEKTRKHGAASKPKSVVALDTMATVVTSEILVWVARRYGRLTSFRETQP